MKIPKNWTFKSDEVAHNFDSHVAEQLPWYPMAVDMLAHLARAYLPINGVLLDLGCSTGAITKELKDIIEDRKISAISIDNSQQMVDAFVGVGDVVCSDMTEPSILKQFDVAVLNLSLMFTPVHSREVLIKNLIKNTNVGGCIIIIDRIEPINAGYLGLCMSRLSMSNKVAAGNLASEILEKELSLVGVQRPSREFLFTNNGFNKWIQVGDFAGFIYEQK